MAEQTQSRTEAWRKLYPFSSHWADLSAGRMHYLDEGPASASKSDAETLLFVHGNPTWSFHWRRLITAFSPGYRCIAPDHIGCGLSEKPSRFLKLDDHIQNLCDLVDQLKLDRITLVAQDWGGAIGLGAMLRLQGRLQHIVLFNTGAFTPRYIPWRIRACRWPVIGRLAVQGANTFSLAALRMTLARKPHLESNVAAGYLAPYDTWQHRQGIYGFVRDIPSPHAEHNIDRQGETNSTARTLAAIERDLPQLADRPSCLVWGMRDWCFRPDCLDRFLQAWPNAEAHRLADVGHWVAEDAPDDAQSIVANFLAKTATANSEQSEIASEPPGLSRPA